MTPPWSTTSTTTKPDTEGGTSRIIEALRGTAASTVTLVLLLITALLQAQGTPPAAPLTLITRDARRTIPTTMLSGQELIALDDVATLFGATVREDALAGGISVAYRGRTVVMSADQPMASVAGRVVALPSPVVRAGRRWLVPVEFLTRALAPIYDQRIELRRQARLLLVGDVRVPRVDARIDAPGPPTRATIELAPAAPVVIATDPGRVLLRIDADALELSLPAGANGLIDQVRAGDQPNTVALLLNPRTGAPRVVQSTADNLTRITVEIPAAAPTTDAALPPASPVPPASPASPAPPALPALSAGQQTIVIDPGHGGPDVGVRGSGGSEEKVVTLEVARRLRSLIESRLGVRVILTRDEDRAVTPDERAAIANNSKADLFLSLHANAAPSAGVAGAEVFHVRLDREGEDARRDAEAEAVSLPVLGGATRQIEVIRWDMAQARHVEQSAVLAGMIEQELRGHVTMSPRALQQAPLRVLVGANMPAALIEMAYLTNPEQEKIVRGEAYQTLIAQSLYDAIVRFRAQAEERALP
jgi:N-acetylmuramoyl-L-alanine amidase